MSRAFYLHDDPTDPGDWFACAQPERPLDESTCFHCDCAPCLVAVRAAHSRGEELLTADGSLLADAMAPRLVVR